MRVDKHLRWPGPAVPIPTAGFCCSGRPARFVLPAAAGGDIAVTAAADAAVFVAVAVVVVAFLVRPAAPDVLHLLALRQALFESVAARSVAGLLLYLLLRWRLLHFRLLVRVRSHLLLRLAARI